jgi:hypothetical protein
MTRRARRLEAKQAQRRAALPMRLVRWSLITIAAIVIGIGVGGGTYAVWNVTAPLGTTATIHAGSATLTASDPGLSAAGLYPGRTVYGVTEVRNTGTTPLALTLDRVTGPTASTPFTSALQVSVGVASSAADCAAGRVAAVVVAAVGAPLPADLRVTLARGGTTQLCIGIGLPQNAPAAAAGAAASPLTLTISGTQVHS